MREGRRGSKGTEDIATEIDGNNMRCISNDRVGKGRLKPI